MNYAIASHGIHMHAPEIALEVLGIKLQDQQRMPELALFITGEERHQLIQSRFQISDKEAAQKRLEWTWIR